MSPGRGSPRPGLGWRTTPVVAEWVVSGAPASRSMITRWRAVGFHQQAPGVGQAVDHGWRMEQLGHQGVPVVSLPPSIPGRGPRPGGMAVSTDLLSWFLDPVMTSGIFLLLLRFGSPEGGGHPHSGGKKIPALRIFGCISGQPSLQVGVRLGQTLPCQGGPGQTPELGSLQNARKPAFQPFRVVTYPKAPQRPVKPATRPFYGDSTAHWVSGPESGHSGQFQGLAIRYPTCGSVKM